ncbi:hypothetical protein [Myxococcus sp. AB036A]|uniref:hypothetical protein n=1 Tax=Myxococcus sp. AB036A TaxID=2562793 RepID=UPI0011469213|nr:hypothetical protein [Myxococcus sp. AB036A]
MSATAIPFYVIPVKVVDFSNARLSLDLGKNQFGRAQPQLDIFLPPGVTHRQLSALLHTYAASLELNTPPNERWIIQTDCFTGTNHGRIFLDLAEGDKAEAMRGMALLNILLG